MLYGIMMENYGIAGWDWCGGSIANAFGSDRWHPGSTTVGTEEGTGIIYGTWHFLPVTIDCDIDAG